MIRTKSLIQTVKTQQKQLVLLEESLHKFVKENQLLRNKLYREAMFAESANDKGEKIALLPPSRKGGVR